jgi:hypothetical protein
MIHAGNYWNLQPANWLFHLALASAFLKSPGHSVTWTAGMPLEKANSPKRFPTDGSIWEEGHRFAFRNCPERKATWITPRAAIPPTQFKMQHHRPDFTGQLKKTIAV